MREEKLKELKLGVKKQQSMFSKVLQESEAAVHASYVLSELIAKHSKPFTDGDFIKECLMKAGEIVCPGNVKAFQSISLSRNTVAERVTDLAANLSDQIKAKSSSFESFSIACDESTDISGKAQLAVFLRSCDKNFNIFEELLELIPMPGTTTGEDIFTCVFGLLQKYNLPLAKLNSVATDGAPSMTGKNKGFVALLRKKLSEIHGSNIHHMHCIIHQEVLCTKVINMENVLSYIKKVINFIRSRGLNQRQFTAFLSELDSEYSGLSYYTEVRWLSCSKILKQFWDLKEEICQFLKTKNQDVSLFYDPIWIQDLSFLVDITKHLTDLNLSLQGKDHIITNMFDIIKAFKCQLVLWEKQLKNEDLTHFPTCSMNKSSLDDTCSYQKYAEKIANLTTEFETRFNDFSSLEDKFFLFSSIFSISIDSVPSHMQMEVIEIQCNSNLKAKFIEVGVPEFYKYLPARFENTRKFAYEIISMFGSTYRCEQLFSVMKENTYFCKEEALAVQLSQHDNEGFKQVLVELIIDMIASLVKIMELEMDINDIDELMEENSQKLNTGAAFCLTTGRCGGEFFGDGGQSCGEAIKNNLIKEATL
ncbi:General transcription factor II-I repeat domain-containing protein 2, partial [Stegodyphus mimosarum]